MNEPFDLAIGPLDGAVGLGSAAFGTQSSSGLQHTERSYSSPHGARTKGPFTGELRRMRAESSTVVFSYPFEIGPRAKALQTWRSRNPADTTPIGIDLSYITICASERPHAHDLRPSPLPQQLKCLPRSWVKLSAVRCEIVSPSRHLSPQLHSRCVALSCVDTQPAQVDRATLHGHAALFGPTPAPSGRSGFQEQEIIALGESNNKALLHGRDRLRQHTSHSRSPKHGDKIYNG